MMVDINKINKRHFLEFDMYYRIEMGLSSKLLKFENGVFHLEVIIGRKWNKNYNAAAVEMANAWKRSIDELNHALACKVYIIDGNKNPYKQVLVGSDIEADYDARKGILFYRQHLN